MLPQGADVGLTLAPVELGHINDAVTNRWTTVSGSSFSNTPTAWMPGASCCFSWAAWVGLT